MSYKVYRGDTPCPNCGITGEKNWRPTKASICNDCKRTYDVGKQILEQQKFNSNELIRVNYRTCMYLFKGNYRSEQYKSIDRGIVDLLQSIDIKTDTALKFERRPDSIDVGSGGSRGCSWVSVLIYKTQWQVLETMIGGFSDFINNYIGDINDLEKRAFEAGQNLLLNLNTDRNFAQKANEYAVKK